MKTNSTRLGIAQTAIAATLSSIVAFGCVPQPAAAFAEETTEATETNEPASSTEEPANSESDTSEVATPKWKRLWGDTRYDTMGAVVDEGWGSDEAGSKWAVLATGKNYPDALCASALAGVAGKAPIILTEPNKLSDQAKARLEDLGVEHVYLMGGTKAISAKVEDALEDMDVDVTRISGDDRAATSAEVFKMVRDLVEDDLTTIMIATGSGFADALSAGPLAYAKGIPILLTNSTDDLDHEAWQAIDNTDTIERVIVLGGQEAVPPYVEMALGIDCETIRIAGEDRYETSAKLAQFMTEGDEELEIEPFGHTWEHPLVATGKDFPDALAGSALAGKLNGVLLLASKPDDPTIDLIKEKAATTYIEGKSYLLGGKKAVSEDVEEELNEMGELESTN